MSEQTIQAAGIDLESDAIAPIPLPGRRRFMARVAWTFATRLMMVTGSVGTSILVARWLGAEGLGELSVVNVTVALVLQIGSAGLPSAMVYFVAKDRRLLRASALNALVFTLTAGSALAVVVVGLSRLSPTLFGNVPTKLIVIGTLSLPFLLITLFGLNLLLATDRVAQFNVLDGAAPLLALLNALVVLLVMHSGLDVLVSFNTGAAALLSLITISMVKSLRHESERWRPNLSLFGKTAQYGWKFYVSMMAGVVIIRADLLIVNWFRGAAEAGVYAVASQVATLLMLLPGVISTLLFPRVAAAADQTGDLAARVTRHTSFLMMLLFVVAVSLSFVLPLVYGKAFADAQVQLLILLPGVYFLSVESVLVQHFTGTGLPAAIPVFWFITVMVSIGLNLMIVPRFGARGAALTSTISYALIFGLVSWYFRRKTKLRVGEILWLNGDDWRVLFKRPAAQ